MESLKIDVEERVGFCLCNEREVYGIAIRAQVAFNHLFRRFEERLVLG